MKVLCAHIDTTDGHNTASSLLHPFCLFFLYLGCLLLFVSLRRVKIKAKETSPQCVAPPPSPCSYPLLRLSRMLGQGGFTSCATSSSESPSRHIRINCYFGTALGPFWYTPFFLSPWQPAEAATSSLYCTRQNTVLHGLFFFLFFFCLNFYLNHRVLVAALCVESWRAVCCNHLK